MSRYDLPRAAPEPLRSVQRFVNSIDREHELDWLDDWFAEHGPVAEPERAPALREAFRALALANNGLRARPRRRRDDERGGSKTEASGR